MIKIEVHIFTIAGLCEKKSDLVISLKEGNIDELEACLVEKFNVDLSQAEDFMILLNGRGVDRHGAVAFKDGDKLWLLPQISGG